MYFDCRYCAVGEYAADVRLGVAGGQTRQARRLLCLAGTSWSFAMASDHLREMSGLQVAANTVRNVCQAEAGRVEQWQASAPQAAAEYAKSSGEVEFFTDGTCVNTTAGWKEMRLGVFTKRPLGDAATPDEWCDRVLPKPTSRHVFAAIESADAFATRWPLVASRLGIRSQRRIDVVADGRDGSGSESASIGPTPWARSTSITRWSMSQRRAKPSMAKARPRQAAGSIMPVIRCCGKDTRASKVCWPKAG